MKIIRIEAENIERIKAIEITPDGNVVRLTGKNAQGKSSALHCIEYGIRGGRAMSKEPVRRGEEEAYILIETEDFTVVREWENGRTSVVVTSKDGAEYRRPQEMLDDLLGHIGFNPLAFIDMKDSERWETLVKALNVDVDLDKLDVQRINAFNQRTTINREVTRLKGVLSELPRPVAGTPKKEINIEALSSQLAVAHNVASTINALKREAGTADERIVELEEDLRVEREILTDKQKALKKLKAPDIAGIEAKLNAAGETNKAVRDSNHRVEVQAELKMQKGDSQKLTDDLETIAATKRDAIAATEFPIKELSFGEDGILYNDLPFDQASEAEKLIASMAIAMALNPDFRVILIPSGSHLDEDNFKIMEKIADDNDFQIWIEQTDTSGKVGIVFHGGQIVKVNK